MFLFNLYVVETNALIFLLAKSKVLFKLFFQELKKKKQKKKKKNPKKCRKALTDTQYVADIAMSFKHLVPNYLLT